MNGNSIPIVLIILQAVNILLTYIVQRNVRQLEKKLDQDIKRIERIKDLVNGTSIASHNLAFTALFKPDAMPVTDLVVPAMTQIWGSLTEIKAITRVVDDKELWDAVDKMEEVVGKSSSSYTNQEATASWIIEFQRAATDVYEASERILNKITEKKR